MLLSYVYARYPYVDRNILFLIPADEPFASSIGHWKL